MQAWTYNSTSFFNMLQRLPTVLRVKCKFSNNSLQGYIIHNSLQFRPLSMFYSSNTNLSIFPTHRVHFFLSLHTCTSPQPSLFTTSVQNALMACLTGVVTMVWFHSILNHICYQIITCLSLSLNLKLPNVSYPGSIQFVDWMVVNFNISIEIIYFQ